MEVIQYCSYSSWDHRLKMTQHTVLKEVILAEIMSINTSIKTNLEKNSVVVQQSLDVWIEKKPPPKPHLICDARYRNQKVWSCLRALTIVNEGTINKKIHYNHFYIRILGWQSHFRGQRLAFTWETIQANPKSFRLIDWNRFIRINCLKKEELSLYIPMSIYKNKNLMLLLIKEVLTILKYSISSLHCEKVWNVLSNGVFFR